MSASPSGFSNGQTPPGRTPNGGPPQFVRKQKAADPLRPRKKAAKRPNTLPSNHSVSQPNGLAPARPTPQNPSNGFARSPVRGPSRPAGAANNPILPNPTGGWSVNPPPGTFTDFPLVTTKRALREGLRYHIARFTAKKTVDPTNQDEFTRPVILHRRDPRQLANGKIVKEEEPIDTPIDSKERERLEAIKEEKERRKAEDLKQIAPTGNNTAALAAKKTQSFRNEKTTQIHNTVKNEEQKKASDLRYEEALPWHIEDADNKNTWVGNYEAALSDTNVLFFIEGQSFKMIPVEKWYKFTPKNQFKTYTIEEAEAQMSKKHKESRWVMKSNEERKAASEAQESRKITHGSLYTVKSESNTFKNSSKREMQDMDDLDFAADDLFQDDDEQATFEPDNDEDTKDAQEKIKREQLGANLFGDADEAEVEKEFAEEAKEEEKKKLLGKGVKKALKKRERNLIYESDSDHPYSTESEDDTSDEEKQAEIDRKKDEETKLKAKSESKLPSGASSKGTNTPAGRPKHTDISKKSKGIKRPGSPNLSESSGNESSRKKPKKKHSSSIHPTGTSTPNSGSRQISPTPSSSGQRKSSIVKLHVNPTKLSEIHAAPPNPSPVHAGSMSEGEATGGEMSDGGKKKKIKLRIGGGSPTGSRAGSPISGRAGSNADGSRATSPQLQNASPAQSPALGPITASDLRAAIPVDGMKIGELLQLFTARIGDPREGKMDRKDFITLVKNNTYLGAEKRLRVKN